MKNFNLVNLFILIAGLILIINACAKQEDASSETQSSSDSNESSEDVITEKVTGYIQKGPFVQGTEVTMRTLRYNLAPTGQTYTGSIEDNSGSFVVRGTVRNRYAELSADGYYFNEVGGALSTSKLNLQALVNLKNASSVNVNLMTHLEKKRLEHLMDNGLSFSEAKSQAQNEVIKMFNIDNVTLGNSETLDISKSGNGNAILLAISAILQSNRTEAELTELLSVINTDIRLDGTLDGENTKKMLLDSMDFIKPIRSTIRSNIESRYNYLGLKASIPEFEIYAFKLDSVLPTVESKTRNYGTNTLLSSIQLVFSEIIDNSSLTSETFFIKDSFGNKIQGEITSSESTTFSTVKFTPTQNISLSDNYTATITTGAKDLNGNQLKQNYSWDVTRPSVTITANEGIDGFTSSNSQLSLTFTTSENTDNFEVSDISVSNGSLSDFTGSNKSYTATLTPVGQGAVIISIPEGKFTDNDSNINTSSAEFKWNYDTTNPTITIAASEGSDGFTSNDSSLSLTFTSTKVTSNFDINDITVTNGTISSFASSSSTTYTATFTPSSDGAVTIDVRANKFTGPAGNSNTASSQFNWTYDSTGPTVSSTSPSNLGTEVIAQNSTISVTFSEAMSTSTVTTNTSNTSCSGSIQVSSDDFSSCIQMSSAPVASNSNKTFTVSSSSMLPSNTTFKIRLSTSVKDSVGNSLSSQYTQDNGFTTETYFTKTGSISSNETWSKSSGNYYVTGNLLVANGATLTIDAGTSIKFASGTYLKVEGFLVAQGTSGNLINIIADNDSTSKNHWLGIYIRPTGKTTYDNNMKYSSGSILKYIKVSNSERGIYAYDTSLLVENSEFDRNTKAIEIRKTDNFTVKNSTFSNNDYGIWSEYQPSDGDSYGNITDTYITSNTYSNNNYAIDLIMNQRDFKNLNIDNNTIKNNSTGIDFGGGGYGPRVHSAFFRNNIIDNNTLGVNLNRIYGTGSNTVLNYPVVFEKNYVINNDNALYLEYSPSVKIKIINNILITDGNGIEFRGAPSSSNHLISNNYISANGKHVYINGSSSYNPSNMNFDNNTFSGNPSTEFIHVKYGSGHNFNYNNFPSTTKLVIKNESNNSIDAENTYWSTTNTSTIDSLIYDYNDDFDLGLVDFNPYQSSLYTAAPIYPPTNTSVSAGSRSFTLSWSANSESDRAGYKVYWDTDSGHPYANVQDVGNLTSKTITGLTSGTKYYVTVTAYDNTYNSANDNSSTIINENQTAGNESWYATEQSITTN